MPNIYGQLHPWERAGVTLGAWRRMFDRLTADHIAADHAVRQLFPGDDHTVASFDPRKFLELSDKAKALQHDWWNAINGDGDTVRHLVERYGLDPNDDHVGP